MPIESLADLRVFRQVVASGGITAAARVLDDSKNRVSQRLAALERALGVRLAHRSTRAFRLTEEGERLFASSGALLEAADRVETFLGSASRLEGRVKVAVRSALGGVGLGAELARLLQSAPGLHLQVAVVDENAAVLEDGFDLAVQVGSLRASALVATRLQVSTYVMAAAPGYLDARGRPRSPRALAEHQCIRTLAHPRETQWSLVSARGRRQDFAVGGTFECDDAQLQGEALYAGLGIGLRPLAEVRRAQADGRLERVLPEWRHVPVPVWMVSPPGRSKVPRVAAVAEVLKRVITRLGH